MFPSFRPLLQFIRLTTSSTRERIRKRFFYISCYSWRFISTFASFRSDFSSSGVNKLWKVRAHDANVWYSYEKDSWVDGLFVFVEVSNGKKLMVPAHKLKTSETEGGLGPVPLLWCYEKGWQIRGSGNLLAYIMVFQKSWTSCIVPHFHSFFFFFFFLFKNKRFTLLVATLVEWMGMLGAEELIERAIFPLNLSPCLASWC
jgi:hypothetical protein